MSMKTVIIVCTWFAVLSCSPCMGQTVAAISDTGMVSLSLDLLRQGIVERNQDKMLETMGEELVIGNDVLTEADKRRLVDSAFETGSMRRTVFPKPSNSESGPFWDFAMEGVNLFFDGDSCVVKCDLWLYAAPRTEDGIPSANETLVFWKRGNCWRLERVSNLFDFLTSGGQ